MNSIDLSKSILAAIEAGNFDFVRDQLTDNFTFKTPDGMTYDKRQYINLQRALCKAMPDLRFNASNFKQVSDRVTYTIQLSGTHTDVLDLHTPGVPVVQPTNRHIRLPQEPVTVTFRDARVSHVELAQVPGGGLAGVLSQLGVKTPQTSSRP